VADVLGVFAGHGFARATVIGEVGAPGPSPRLTIR
jgi:hypothetical protein